MLGRIIDSAIKRWEETFFKHIMERLPASVKSEMDRLLCSNIPKVDDPRNDSLDDSIVFRQLKAEPGRVSLRSILNETSKLETIRKISLPADLFDGTLPKILKRYRDRVITEPAREMRRLPPYIRYALFERKIGESYKIITFMFEYTVIKAYATPSSHRCTRSLASYYRSWN